MKNKNINNSFLVCYKYLDHFRLSHLYALLGEFEVFQIGVYLNCTFCFMHLSSFDLKKKYLKNENVTDIFTITRITLEKKLLHQ